MGNQWGGEKALCFVGPITLSFLFSTDLLSHVLIRLVFSVLKMPGLFLAACCRTNSLDKFSSSSGQLGVLGEHHTAVK